jgi:hypothetical protein
MSRINRFRVVTVILGVLVLAVWVAISSAASPPSVSIAPGLTPRLGSADAAKLAQSNIALMARSVAANETSTVTKIMAVRGDQIDAAQPGAGSATGDQADDIYWIVRASGTFVARRGPAGGDRVYPSGYILISDATGDVVGFGMP